MITVAALTTLIYYGIGLLFILFVAVSLFSKISTQFSLITQNFTGGNHIKSHDDTFSRR